MLKEEEGGGGKMKGYREKQSTDLKNLRNRLLEKSRICQ